MKRKISNLTILAALLLSISLLLFSCGELDLWKDAVYKEDTTLGEGAKTLTVQIIEGDNSVTLTVKTDAENIGTALYELALINDASFFDTINGMTASWEKHQAYWAFYVGDTMSNVGVADVKISGGESFKFVYTK